AVPPAPPTPLGREVVPGTPPLPKSAKTVLVEPNHDGFPFTVELVVPLGVAATVTVYTVLGTTVTTFCAKPPPPPPPPALGLMLPPPPAPPPPHAFTEMEVTPAGHVQVVEVEKTWSPVVKLKTWLSVFP